MEEVNRTLIMPRTVRACIFSSIFPTDEDRFRLVFLEHCNGDPQIFQTTLRNLSNAEVATGFFLLYNSQRDIEHDINLFYSIGETKASKITLKT